MITASDKTLHHIEISLQIEDKSITGSHASYIQKALYNYWIKYFYDRGLSLHDFDHTRSLESDINILKFSCERLDILEDFKQEYVNDLKIFNRIFDDYASWLCSQTINIGNMVEIEVQAYQRLVTLMTKEKIELKLDEHLGGNTPNSTRKKL